MAVNSNKNKYNLTFLVNSLFMIVLLCSFPKVENKFLNENYTLLFELEDTDLIELDRFEDLFEFSSDADDVDNTDNEIEFDQDADNESKSQIAYFDTKNNDNKNSYSIQSSDEIDEYIRENEDYIDDLTYVENIDTIKQIKNEDLNLNSYGYMFRRHIAKVMVHNAFRNSPIYYSQDISI
jgi:hypothetical protein